MLFETEAEALRWFESEDRVLTKDFLEKIPWHEIKNHPLDPAIVPIISYMRDIEVFTDVYHQEMLRTPTGKDPHIKSFMERWSTEEPLHGEVLNRFLEEAGIDSAKTWDKNILKEIPFAFRLQSNIKTFLANAFGKHFTAVHMTWGAIQEQTTLIGYRTLWEKAKHPVLEQILRGIAREEARHAFFYWSVSRIKLLNSRFRQQLSRYLVEKFWAPVGQGAKTAEETNALIRALFDGAEGLKTMKTLVNDRITQLPGFSDFTKVTNRIANIISPTQSTPSGS